jgi:ribonuclease P protein component
VLPAEHRLRDPEGFRRAGRRGNRATAGNLTLHHLIHSDYAGQPARVGFVVSKAVGNAVARNRVKRRLRAAVAPRLSALPDGSVLVLRAKPSAAAADFERLAADVDLCLAGVARTEASR